jgi:hypothetical protein
MMFVAAMIFAAAPAVGDELPPQRPMEDMHGDCANFAWNMKRELALWQAKPAAIQARGKADMLAELQVDQRSEVALVAHSSVAFTVPPQKDRGGSDKFSGLVAFTPAKDGVYRISAGSGVWMDAVVKGAIVTSSRFEMQTKCASVFKSVAFTLKGGEPVTLQINGSATPTVGLLVTEWKD